MVQVVFDIFSQFLLPWQPGKAVVINA